MLLTAYHSLFTIYYLLLTTYYLLLTAYHSLITTYHLPLTTYHLPLTTYYLLFTTYYLLLTTYYLLLTTYYLLLTTYYLLPAKKFEPIAKGSHDGLTVLYIASRNGDVAIVTALLEAGADRNAANWWYCSQPMDRGADGQKYEEIAWCAATTNGHSQVCDLLAKGSRDLIEYMGTNTFNSRDAKPAFM